MLFRSGASSTSAAQKILQPLLTGAERPTAILASDSRIALEIFRAAKRAGLRIPDDLSLITFDDADWTSALDPAVTVVSQPTYELGQTAADMLITRMRDGAASPERRQLRATLVLRNSVRERPYC